MPESTTAIAPDAPLTAARRPSRAEILALLLLALAAPTLIFPGRWTVLGALLLAASWLVRWAATGRFAPRTALDWPIVVLVSGTLVGTAVSSLPAVSASKAWGIVLGVSVCYALAGLPGWRLPAVADGLAALGALLALVALVGTDWTNARLIHQPLLDALYDRLPVLIRGLPGSGLPGHGELFNPREVGGTLALLLPLPAVTALAARGRRRLLLTLAALSMGAVLLLSQTPSAIAGGLASLWLGLVVADRAHRRTLPSMPQDQAQGRLWLLGGLATVVMGLVGGLWWLRSAVPSGVGLSARATSGPDHSVLGLASRLELWPRALQLIHDHPYTGIGLNTFPWVADRFAPGYILGPEVHAHNFVLQVGVDFGLPGLVAFAWLLAAWFWGLLAVWRRAAPGANATLALGLGAGLLAHLLFGLLDAVTLGAKPGVLLWALLGLGLGLMRSTQPGPPARRLDLGFGLVLVLALLAPLAWDGPRLNAGRLLASRTLLPESPWFDDTELLAVAGDLLTGAASTDPANPTTWYALGMVRGRQGSADAAVAALRNGALADSRGPRWRYALQDALFGAPLGADWAGLVTIQANWVLRYPLRAEWYVTRAIGLAEGLGDRAAGLALLERGLAAGAEPRAVLEAARAQLR